MIDVDFAKVEVSHFAGTGQVVHCRVEGVFVLCSSSYQRAGRRPIDDELAVRALELSAFVGG